VPAGHFGHPGIAFGGYVAGILAQHAPRGVKVDFRRPAPVGVEMTLAASGPGTELRLNGEILAVAAPHFIAVRVPRSPSWDEALTAVGTYIVDTRIEHASCFGCGHARAPEDGLRIFTGKAADGDLVVAAWRPSRHFADQSQPGDLAPEYAWAALDCPGGWARKALTGQAVGRGLTAYLAADLVQPVQVAQPYIVIGWPISRSGRKTVVGSAILTLDGDVCAIAEALLIDIPD